jgi:hypothetical protein
MGVAPPQDTRMGMGMDTLTIQMAALHMWGGAWGEVGAAFVDTLSLPALLLDKLLQEQQQL